MDWKLYNLREERFASFQRVHCGAYRVGSVNGGERSACRPTILEDCRPENWLRYNSSLIFKLSRCPIGSASPN